MRNWISPAPPLTIRMMTMRGLLVACAVLAASTAADARSHKRAHRAKKKHPRIAVHEPVRGQSIGAPWDGELRDATRLPDGDGYVIRRPQRAFGTRSTIERLERAIADWRDSFPDAHVLAIGDISAEHGGAITEHHSHQSGRDADVGLVYKIKPAVYPHSFVTATDDNLDLAATFALVAAFAETAHEDGGVQVMFLDFEVQRMLYEWALDHDVDESQLARLFQFPHGRGASAGLVRHEPNHDNHVHVRFKCPVDDVACR
jgi:murein endopeptidase